MEVGTVGTLLLCAELLDPLRRTGQQGLRECVQLGIQLFQEGGAQRHGD
jgi:hypothetical protein